MVNTRKNHAISSDELAELLLGQTPKRGRPVRRVRTEKAFDRTKCFGLLTYGSIKRGIRIIESPQMFVAKSLLSKIACGVLLRYSNRWHALPYAIHSDEMLSKPLYEIEANWIFNLIGLIGHELIPLGEPLVHVFQLAPDEHADDHDLDRIYNTYWRKANQVFDEILAKCNIANFQGIKTFFQTPESLTPWIFCSEWENWNARGISINQRLRNIVAGGGCSIDKHQYHEIVELYGLENQQRSPAYIRISSSHQKTEIKSTPAESGKTTLTKSEDVLKTWPTKVANQDYERTSTFSYGGPSHVLFTDHKSEYLTGFPTDAVKDEAFLIKRLWWWRESYYSDSFEWLLFKDNWQRSAFIYELRARHLDPKRWDFYDRPWIRLNYSERAILSILWPPKHSGAYRLHPWRNPIFTKLSNEYFHLSENIVGGHFKMHHPWSLQSAPPWTRFF